jgi:sulfur-oxidizing protein SoxY
MNAKPNRRRRQVVGAGGASTLLSLLAAAGWLAPGTAAAAAWNQTAFDAKSPDETVRALGGIAAVRSKDITFVSAPDIAENGAIVPLTVASAIPRTEAIAILVEKNATTLAAVFEIPPGTEPSIGTRIKMAQTSNVHVLVKADGKFYTAVKEIKVTLGGCG